MLATIKHKIIKIEPEDVLADARNQDLDVTSIADFRHTAPRYDRIESMIDYYRSSYANTSILGGLTTGIGGFMTSVTFASIDTASMGLQLYRLSQRFAILNGFDSNDPLQHDKIMNIYFEALGLNAVAQATLKGQLLKVHTATGSRQALDSIVLRLIVKMGKLVSKNLSSKSAGRLVPVAGGIAGASLNYLFARKTSQKMKEAYKCAYFEKWQ